jgi:GT2 family glycosyltransferase
MKKIFIIIPTNRCQYLPQETVTVIEETKTPTILVKQNLSLNYKNHPYIKEITSNQTGASRARNLGIKFALKQKAEILAFIDDDCIITKNWIKNIVTTFKDPKINIVFGQTLPYQPKKNLGKYCPCIFTKKNHQPISWPVSTWDYIGMSNNFAITTEIIHTIGFFSPKIGPGTKIPGGEDADFIIRAIKSGFPIHYNHKALLYHNNWLEKHDLQLLYQKYTFSFAYIYCFHAFHTDISYLNILIKEFFKEISHYIKYLKQIPHPSTFINSIINHNKIIFNFFKGCLYSFFAIK